MTTAPGLTPEQDRELKKSTVVPRLSRRFAKRTTFIDEDELESAGHEQEFLVARRWDGGRGVPFEAFTYPPVHIRMRTEVAQAREIKTREQTGHFGPAYEFLEHSEESDNFLSNSDEESRRALIDHYSGILGGLMAGWVAESAVAPSEDELHEKIDLPRRRAQILETMQNMGDEGKLLLLRYVERLEWADVAIQLGITARHATNVHNQALPRLVALLAKKKR